MEKHNIKPLYNKDSKILILGSFPSVKSREAQFYYYHPQNRFWKIMEKMFNEKYITIDDKKRCMLKHHIAIWDVIESCEIKGSSDSSIKNIKINNIKKIIEESQIDFIYTNGKKSYDLYNKYCLEETKIKAISLPSTSPANATYTFDKLYEAWKVIKKNLE